MTEDLEQSRQSVTKLFPYFVMWQDAGPDPCDGYCHARSIEEAANLAEIRLTFGSLLSIATIYKGHFWGRSKQIRRYRWKGSEIVYSEF